MASSGKPFDARAFFRGLNMADQRVRKALRRGFTDGLAHGEKLAKDECPIDQRRGHSGGTLAATIVGDPDTIKITDKSVTAELVAGGGEASDYALRQHEEELVHSHPRSGRYASKFIEKALKALTGLLPRACADEVKKELGT